MHQRPEWATDIRTRLSVFSIAPAREAEIIEELTQHLDDRWRELITRGVTPQDAERLARAELEGPRFTELLGSLKQAHWQPMPIPGPARAITLDSLRTDFRHALRSLAATPSFTIGALLVLALGIGATMSIYSVVDAVALRPLPFSESDRIVAVGVHGAMPGGAMPGAKAPDPDALSNLKSDEYFAWARRQQAFESAAAISDMGDLILQSPGGEPELIRGQRVTASFFDVLSARPALGAAFTANEEVAGRDRVAVISHTFWQRHFAAETHAVGRTMSLGDDGYTVIGVMPAGFIYPPGATQPTDVWVPWVAPRENPGGGGARALGGDLQSIARLRPGVSAGQAQARLSQLVSTTVGRTIGVRQLRDHFVGTSTTKWMLMLLGAVAIVLLIACANIANLWLARASVQQRETAVRAALGASRGRLAQRVLIESLLVSLAGTFVGVILAWLGSRALAGALPEHVVHVAAIGINARVLAVAAATAIVTAFVSGIAPAVQSSNPPLTNLLNESGRGGGTSRGRRRIRSVLVVMEVAFAVVLLVGAALFLGSFINVMRIDPGFRAQGVLAAQVLPPRRPGQDRVDVRRELAELVERARKLPEVTDAAAAAPGIPFRVNLRIDGLRAPGAPVDVNKTVSLKSVTPGYHRTLAIRLLGGRYFSDDDREGGEAVVILSQAAARLQFGSENPVGQAVDVVGAGVRRVVGVVANARQSSLEASPHPEIYLPLAQVRSESYGFVLLHTNGDPNHAVPGLRSVLAQILPGVPLRQVARLEDLMAAQTAERRLSMMMFGAFGLLGLVIAAVGIFAVIAYLVSQQTREIGIRMALGATRSRVVAGVFGQVGRLVAAGLLAGGFAAWSLSSAAGRFLFGLDPQDPRAYAAAMIILPLAAFVAALLPARRAASVDPGRVLQQE
jgi:predicted permease